MNGATSGELAATTSRLAPARLVQLKRVLEISVFLDPTDNAVTLFE